jgi:SAM-dependent methyltransferase
MNEKSPSPDILYQIKNKAWATAAMLAGMELDLFSPLDNGPMSSEQLALALDVNSDKLGPLLYALTLYDLLIEEDGQYSNTPETAEFFVKGKEKYIGESYKIWMNNLKAALTTAETIKTGVAQAKYDWKNMDKNRLEELMEGMAAFDHNFANWLSTYYDFSEYESLLDAGCGSGTLAIAMTQIHPKLNATVVDFPHVTPITIRTVDSMNAGDRVNVISADLTKDPVPGKYDAALLSSIIQTLSPEESRQVILNVGNAVKPGGCVFIFGSGMLQDSRRGPKAAIDMNLVFITVYDHGRSYTETELRGWLNEAGFSKINFDYDNLAITAQKDMEE